MARMPVRGKLPWRSLKTRALANARTELPGLLKQAASSREVGTSATICIESGVDVPTVAQWLGHKGAAPWK